MRHDREDNVATNVQARLDKLEAETRSAKWWRRTALALVVAVLCLPFAARGVEPVPNTFVSGEVISAAKMNGNFTHLQDAITALEGNVPAGTCGADQIARYNGTTWECSDDTMLTTTDPNLSIDDAADTISLGSDLVVTSLSANALSTGGLNLSYAGQWNNSNANGTTEMTVFAASGCDSTTRGQLRILQHEDIGNSIDIGDTLCFCQRYLDRTPEPDAEYYRWVCLYPQSDGN